MGTVEGAVYTVTLLPPPCGISAMDRTLTPIVAQSSVDASLSIVDKLPVCDCGIVGLVGATPLEPPPPQAASSAAIAPANNNRDSLGTMIPVSSKLAKNFPWHFLARESAIALLLPAP